MTGWTVWGSSVIAARYLAQVGASGQLAGTRVLELGAGCGLAGLAAAQHAPAQVWLTDFNAATVANLRANAEANAEQCAPCALLVSAMDWDDPATWPADEAGPRAFQLVLGADLVYRRSYARKLAEVLAAVVAPGGAFCFAPPGQREGLPTLRQALERMGWACERELEAPPEWRTSPLARAPDGADGVCDADVTHFPELAMKSMAYPLNLFVWRRPAEQPAQ